MNRRVLSIVVLSIILSTSIIPVNAWAQYEDFSTYTETDGPGKGTLVNDFWVKYEKWDSNLYGDGPLHWIGIIDVPVDFVATFKANYTFLVNSGGNVLHRFLYVWNTGFGNAHISVEADKPDGATFNYKVRLQFESNEAPGGSWVRTNYVFTRGVYYWFKLTYNGFVLRLYCYANEVDMLAQQNELEILTHSPMTVNNPNWNRVQINKPLAVGQTYIRYGHLRDLEFGSALKKGSPIFNHFDFDGFNMNGTIHSGYVVYNDYLYKGEVYNLSVNVVNCTYVKVNFTDGQNIINFEYWNITTNNQTDVFRVSSTDRYVISELSHFVTKVNDTYHITWTFILQDNIVDSRPFWNIYVEHILANSTVWSQYYLMCQIGIYNLGGEVFYNFNGDGYKESYGDVFELGATNGSTNSYAYAEIIFKRLQHVNMLVELDLDNEWDTANFDLEFSAGYYDFGIDYFVGNKWVTGWYARMYPIAGSVGHFGLGSDASWVEWSIDWYNLDPLTNTTLNKKTDYLLSYHWGYDHVDGDEYTNRTSCQFWVDLWYSNRNSSTVVAGRVNSYYYGMYEQGNPFWFGYGKFRPAFGVETEATFYDNLYDDNNKVTNCQKFTLMKFWVKVGTVNIADANDETWSIIFNQNPNFKQADDRMMGVETPILHETKVLDMPQTGFLTPLQRAIEGISKAIWLGALGFIRILWGAMDSLFEYMGFPANTFSNIISFILSIPRYLNALLSNLPFITQNLLTSISQTFSLLIVTIPRYLYGLGIAITIFISYINEIVSLFTGGWANVGDIWATWNVTEWIQLFIVAVLPFKWLERIGDSKDKVQTVTHDLQIAYHIFTGVLSLLFDFVKILINIVEGIRSALPI